MKNSMKYWQGLATAVFVIGALLFFSMETLAEGPRAVQLGQPAKELSAEWWQWVYSLPPSVNPVLGNTVPESVTDCIVGQRGDVWFLAGTFGGPVTRNCSVPEGKVLFFPVINASFFDSPNACGQGPESNTVKAMRAAIDQFIDAATEISVTLDGRPVRNIQRVRSEVFEVSFPKDNVYAFFGLTPCEGVYSPAVDDGYYAHLNSLPARKHPYELHIQAVIPDPGGFAVDVTYQLTVVPVKGK